LAIDLPLELRLARIPEERWPVKDRIIVGASGGDRAMRDWIAGLDAATGRLLWRKYTVPAPGEPGSETWKDKNNAWQTGGGAMWVTGTYDPETDQTIWGTGNPAPMYDPNYRPGDNLFTNSAISWNPQNGRVNWYFQYTPGDMWDYDEVGTHILIDDNVAGSQRKLVTHSARNGFVYTVAHFNGQIIGGRPYMDERGEARLRHGIVFIERHEHADAPHALGRLRARRQPTRSRRRALQ
jgi:alcohol dehydrogenase (cytochrome c)